MRLLVQHCAVLRRALPDVAGMVTEHLLVASHRCQTPAGVRGGETADDMATLRTDCGEA